MSTPYQPKGLDAWLAILDDSLLPVMPASAKVLGDLMKDPDVSLHDIGTLIEQDPVMTVHLIREVNRAFSKKAAGTLTNVRHGLSLLGLDRVGLLAKQFKALKGNPEKERDMAYLRAIMQSLHASEQARAWNSLRRQAAPEHVYLSTLMAGVPMWCLWRFAYKEMEIINTLQTAGRIPVEDAEKAVLGCTREQIILGLAKRWLFPDNILDALNSDKLPSHRYLANAVKEGLTASKPVLPNKDETGRIANTPSFPVALANWLAQEASIDWYSRQTYRCLAIIGGYLGVKQEDLWLVVRGAALQTSLRFPLPGVYTPGLRLIFPPLPPRRRRIRLDMLSEVVGQLDAGETLDVTTGMVAIEKESAGKVSLGKVSTGKQTASKTSQTPIHSAPPVPGNKPSSAGFKNAEAKLVFDRYLVRMIKEVGYFAAEHAVIRSSADVLFETTDLERVVIGLVDRGTASLRGYYAVGCDDSPALAKFEIGLKPPNFFSNLLRKPQAAWINPERPADIPGVVPGEFKQVSQSDEYFVMSVFNGKGPFGILYADKGLNGGQTLSEAELKVCRTLANASSKHLILMARRGK